MVLKCAHCQSFREGISSSNNSRAVVVILYYSRIVTFALATRQRALFGSSHVFTMVTVVMVKAVGKRECKTPTPTRTPFPLRGGLTETWTLSQEELRTLRGYVQKGAPKWSVRRDSIGGSGRQRQAWAKQAGRQNPFRRRGEAPFHL